MDNPFFKNHGPFKISELLKTINLEENKIQTDTEISDIKDLNSSDKNQITFYHSKKYKDAANITKASFCITYDNLINDLPKSSCPIAHEK